LKAGLPTIAVRDLEIQRRENDLVIATFGRGFYVLDDYSPLRNFKKEDMSKTAIVFPVKESLMFIERFPLGLRDKGHMGSSYFSTPNPKPGAVFTYYLKDDIKKLKEKRQDAEKAKFEKKQKVFYPSMDSLRAEDNQVDPYLLFTIKDQSGNVVRSLKANAKKGLQRIVWDFRFNTPAPVVGRYKPAADQLFGGEELGSLVAPGEYSVSLSKYEDGVVSELAGPVKFNCKLLDQSSLPTDMSANASFARKVDKLRKAVSACNDLLNGMDTRIKNVNLAIQDMPAPPKALLEKSYGVSRELIDLKLKLFGDETKGRREFETLPSINDRVGGVESVMAGTTNKIPKTYFESYAIAARQFTALLASMKKTNESLKQLEQELELNHAPYTPGRWPEWKEE